VGGTCEYGVPLSQVRDLVPAEKAVLVASVDVVAIGGYAKPIRLFGSPKRH
jgi:hypothetical protein